MPEPTAKRIQNSAVAEHMAGSGAVDAIEKLRSAGFQAYLVGGCVRDALCGVTPKDFDVATDAHPEEVKALFRRSRLVGRRFPIAHVRYGREIIEVSTFRQGQTDHDDLETDAQGLIVRDRAFGTVADDAFRRDFTVNALYYDTVTNEILDYVGGIDDVANRALRFIGEPQQRLAEDPVRMLRAMRFAAKLGFSIDPGITAQLEDTAERLEAIPKARLFDEFLKMFLSGYAGNVWELIKDTPLVRSLFPSCNPDSDLVLAAMRNTDERIGNDLPVTPGFLVAVILWDDYASRVSEYNPEGKPALMYDLAMDTFAVQQQHIAMPRRFTMFAREVWQLQPRLEQRQPRNIDRLLSHKRFRAAFDFLMLRGREDNKLAECAKWWEKVQTLDKAGRQEMIDKLPKGQQRKRRRRGRNKPAGSHEHSGTVFGQPRFDDY